MPYIAVCFLLFHVWRAHKINDLVGFSVSERFDVNFCFMSIWTSSLSVLLYVHIWTRSLSDLDVYVFMKENEQFSQEQLVAL